MTGLPMGSSGVRSASGMCQVAKTRPESSRARLRPKGSSLGSRYPRNPISSQSRNVVAKIGTCRSKDPATGSTPCGGTVTDASGVSHTAA